MEANVDPLFRGPDWMPITPKRGSFLHADSHCVGIKLMYKSDRSEIIWTDGDIVTIKKTSSAEIGWAVDLAAHTGLRLGDLLRLPWSCVGSDAIVIATGKSGHRREAIVPLYDALKAVLASIPRRSPIILTNTRSRP